MRIHGEQVFMDGLFNADPHPGNVMLLHGAHSNGVGLIDFGQVKEPRTVQHDFKLSGSGEAIFV